jgi:hypothetical protein
VCAATTAFAIHARSRRSPVGRFAVILITGMQRSGTSMVCQLLARLGVSFGDPDALLPADRWNPGGYFEAKAVMDVNSRMMTGRSRHRSRLGAWTSQAAYLRMPRPAAIAARAGRHRDEVVALGRRYRDSAVKDPRFCLTLRFWREWADVDTIIVCMRDPGAIIESLRRRYKLPRWLAARFYEYHVDNLLAALPEHAVHFVDVDRLVAGHADELDALRRGMGLVAGPPSAELLQEVVREELFNGPGDPAACPARARAARDRLAAVAAARRAPGARVEAR